MRVAWLTAVATAVALALPAPAGAVFSKNPQPVSEQDPTVGIQGGPTVGVDPSGRSLVAWTVNNAAGKGVAKVRRVESDGSMGSVLEVSDGTMQAGPPIISFTGTGRAFLAWAERASSSDRGNIRARWLETNDQLGPQFTVEAGDAQTNSDPGEHAATTTSTGGAMVAWHNFDGTPGPFRHVQGRFIGADGSVGPYLYPDSVTSTGVRTQPNSSGGVLLAWKETAIRALSFDANGGGGVLRTPAPNANANAELSTDGADHFHLVYRKQVSATPPQTYSIEYIPLGADGTSGTAQDLDPPGTILPRFYVVATNPANRSLAAWTRSDGTRDVVKARFIAGNGVPEADTFSAPDATLNQDVAGVAIGGSGGGAVVYHLIEATRRTAWGRIVPPTGPAPDPIMLSSATGDVARLQLAIAANDLGLTAWNELDPGGNRQVFIRRIGPNPDPPDPAAAGADQAIAAALVTGSGVGGSVLDRIAPIVRRFSISSQLVLLSRSAVTARRRQKKTTFRLGYSEPATARITVERRRRCPPRRGRRRCKRYRRVGTLRAGRLVTTATASFRRRIGKHRLRPGRYRATAVAVDRAGNRSRPKRLNFRVARR